MTSSAKCLLIGMMIESLIYNAEEVYSKLVEGCELMMSTAHSLEEHGP